MTQQRRSKVREPGPREAPQVAEDMPFQKRTWAVERVAWVAMALLLVAALLGLFSVGPLSRTQAGSPEALRVSYERFERYQAPSTLRLDLGPAAVAAGEAAVHLGRAFVEAVQIEQIRPEPREAAAAAGGLRLVFDVVPEQPASIYLQVRPQKIGFIDGSVGLAGGATVGIGQFVYP